MDIRMFDSQERAEAAIEAFLSEGLLIRAKIEGATYVVSILTEEEFLSNL